MHRGTKAAYECNEVYFVEDSLHCRVTSVLLHILLVDYELRARSMSSVAVSCRRTGGL